MPIPSAQTVFGDGTGPITPPTSNYEGISPAAPTNLEGIRAFFFDVDDTWIRKAEAKIHGPAWNHILEPWGLQFYRYDTNGDIIPTPETDDVIIVPETGLRLIPKSMHPGIGKPPPEVTKHFMRVATELGHTHRDGLDPDPKIHEAMRRRFVFKGTQPDGYLTVEPNPGTVDFVNQLMERGIGVGVITNGSLDHAGPVIRRIGLDPRKLDSLVYGGKTRRPKPYEDPFLLARREMQARRPDLGPLEPDSIVMVGDSINSDIRGANRLGWRTIGVVTPHNTREGLTGAGADIVIHTFNELRFDSEGRVYHDSATVRTTEGLQTHDELGSPTLAHQLDGGRAYIEAGYSPRPMMERK